MANAAHVYVSNQNGYYPIAHYTQTVESVPAVALIPNDPSVSVVEPPNATETVGYSYCWDFTTILFGENRQIVPGHLWEGETLEKVQQCPSYKGQDNWSGSAYSGYNYNTSYIGHGESESVGSDYTGEIVTMQSSAIVLPAKDHQVANTAQCILFGDGHYSGGANKFMRAPVVWSGDTDWALRTSGTQGFRHNGQTNAAWVDGHVSSQKDCYTDTHSKFKPQLDAYNEVNKVKIGYISSNNSLYDLK